ncbi:carbohydrate kinase family protein [Streptomyces fragilis]|uniref:Carbohydrate kinase family protein n=1 Tax=Streptomyces fragilis TaxID=67301 RepID=A0ABV2YC62_9ACTN|nr:carbohydrate kinase family protein [Streptomyces fragilis]
MTTPRTWWDLASFSYLAHAQVLHVTRYPGANQGAEVNWTASSLAADGPLVARACAQAGLRTALVANRTGSDPTGRWTTSALNAAGVHHPADGVHAPRRTPQLTVVTDDAGTRTWFADLTHAYAGLHQADTAPLAHARLAYVDGYTVIAEAAAEALRTASAAGTPVLLNLGGDLVHAKLRDAARQARLHVVQTSVPEARSPDAVQIAHALLDDLQPEAAVVTMGALGAVAVTRTGRQHMPADRVDVVHTHGAGAAFSAELAAAHLRGEDLTTALHRACAAGTAHCAASPSPTVRERTAS